MSPCVVCGEEAGTGGSRYRHRPAQFCSPRCKGFWHWWNRRNWQGLDKALEERRWQVRVLERAIERQKEQVA